MTEQRGRNSAVVKRSVRLLGVERSPGDVLTPDELDEVPARNLSALVFGGVVEYRKPKSQGAEKGGGSPEEASGGEKKSDGKKKKKKRRASKKTPTRLGTGAA